MRAVCHGVIPLLAVAASAACADSAATSSLIQRADSAGVSIVTSSGTDQILEWRLEKLFELGGREDGPESFFRLHRGTVARDGAGNLFVLDASSHRIAVFDPTGLSLRVMGREGSGPGEMSSPNTLAVNATGSAYIFDFQKGALVAFGPEGSGMSQVPFQHFPAPFTKRHFATSDSSFIVLTRTSTDSIPQRTLRWLDNETPITAIDVPDTEMVRYECGVGLRLAPIFSPDILWDVVQGTVAFASGPEYSIDLWRGGRVTHILRRALTPRTATRELAEAKLGDGMNIGLGDGGIRCEIPPAELVEGRGFASQIPLIEDLAFTPSGEIWVARTSAGPDPSRVLDIFAADGAYVGTLTGTEMPLVFLPGDRIGLKETDDFDVDRLAIYQIAR